MSEKPNHRLTEEEITVLCTQEGAYAAVMGYLKAERGKIAPSIFNKMVKRLGYPKQNKEDLVDLAGMVNNDPVMNSIYTKAFNREIKLSDIPDIVEEANKLKEENLFSHVTSFITDNEENNARLREMRKLQREGAYMKILMDSVKASLKEELKGLPKAKYLKTTIPQDKKSSDTKEKSLVLFFSDWHIGAVVYNEETGGYNFTKLTNKVQDILVQVSGLIDLWNITHVHVFHLGDTIEHISMRNVNQAFESEFPAAQQITKGMRLLTDVLISLEKKAHVTFGIIAGNHDRFQGNKNDKVYNDNAAYIIIDMLFFLQELGLLTNTTLIDNRDDTYEIKIDVAGKYIKLKHGDFEKKKDDRKIPKHIKDRPIDIYVNGHVHTTSITQEDYARFHIYVGSTMGANNFSKELSLPTTASSQMVMLLTEGSDSPIFLPLFV